MTKKNSLDFLFRRCITRWPEQQAALSPKARVTAADGHRAIGCDRYGMSPMFEQLGSIKVLIASQPGSRDVSSIGQHAKVRNEPHPVRSQHGCHGERNEHPEHRSAPQGYQRHWIRLKETVWQMPGQQVSPAEPPSGRPSSQYMPRLMRERHHTPRHDQQPNQFQGSRGNWFGSFN